MKEINIEKIRDGVQAVLEQLDIAYAAGKREDIKVAINIGSFVLDYLNHLLYNKDK